MNFIYKTYYSLYYKNTKLHILMSYKNEEHINYIKNILNNIQLLSNNSTLKENKTNIYIFPDESNIKKLLHGEIYSLKEYFQNNNKNYYQIEYINNNKVILYPNINEKIYINLIPYNTMTIYNGNATMYCYTS